MDRDRWIDGVVCINDRGAQYRRPKYYSFHDGDLRQGTPSFGKA